MKDTTQLAPPIAPRRPTSFIAHGDERVDDWAWLRDRGDPAVLAHLRAEQAYTESATDAQEPLRNRLFAEIRSRIVETDLSVPVAHDGWWYYQRTVEGLDYPLHCRAPRSSNPHATRIPGPPQHGRPGLVDEQVILDENTLTATGAYLALGDLVVSPEHGHLAYSVDSTGDEQFTLTVVAIDQSSGGSSPPDPAAPTTTSTAPVASSTTPTDPAAPATTSTEPTASRPAAFPDQIEGTSYGVAWADEQTIFYTRPDAANRPYQLWRHVVGSDPSEDALLHQEDDERFHLGVARTKDGSHVLLELHSKITSEIWALRSTDPAGNFKMLLARRPGVECMVEHHGQTFLVLTNDGAENFRLMAMADGDGSGYRPPWRELMPGRAEARIDGIDVFERYVVVYERLDADARIRILPLPEGGDRFVEPLGLGWLVPCADTPSTSWGGTNPEFSSHSLRYEYSSLVTPRTVYDLDMETGRAVLLKQQQVLGTFEPEDYISERLWADTADGTRVPVSVVRRSSTPLDGTAPCLLYGYGAYEHSVDPVFSSIRLSLLDRGMVFAIAHVRGGGELGRHWYEEGKLAAKVNSITDFVACAEMLVRSKWADPGRLVARGGSAGGILMGGAMNLAPDHFRAVVAEVPFVDCLTTMLDETLPLTVIERDEWGDPLSDPEIYRAMLEYSPYDNVRPVSYPDVLATTGLEDPRVGFWEPAKWVQKLRAASTDNLVMLKVELEAGHAGASGRYDAWRDEAFILAFILASVGADR